MATRFGNRGTAAGPAGGKKGRFAGADLSLGLGKPLLPDGTHIIEVGETKRSTIRGDTFFADVTIISSEDPTVKPGAQYLWMRTLKDSYGYGVAEVCRFAVACGNLDEAGTEQLLKEVETGTSVVDAACGEETEYGPQPLTGCRVKVRVSRVGVAPAKDGRVYPNCEFSPAPEA